MPSETTQAEDSRLLTVSEVARRCRCRTETVRRWITKGQLPSQVLPGGAYRVREADLDAVIRPVTPTG